MAWAKFIAALAAAVPFALAQAQTDINSIIEGVSVFTIAIDPVTKDRDQGSGVIVDGPRGLVLCTFHQVEGFSDIIVVTERPRVEYAAIVIYRDRDHDLAILETAEPLRRAAMIGDADNLSPLDDLYANATLAGLEFQRTKGAVASVDVKFEGNMVFTVNMSGQGGSSGGAIFNEFGKVVGIASRDLVDQPGIFMATRINSAYPMLRKARVPIPSDKPPHQQIIPSRDATDDDFAAIEHFNRGLRADPKDFKTKVEQYGLAVERADDFFEAWFNFGIALTKTGQYNQAEAAYEIASRLRPQSASVYRNLGLLYLDPPFNDNRSAQEIFEKLVKHRKRAPSSHNFLGESLRRQGKFGVAAEVFEQALVYDPNYAKAHFNLAWTFLYMSDGLEDAKKHMDLYQKLSPNAAEQKEFDDAIRKLSQ